MSIPPKSVALVNATPLHERDAGVMACVEFTVYDDGHTAIAVSRVGGKPRNRSITQAETLPLNDVDELRLHLEAIVDFVASSRR